MKILSAIRDRFSGPDVSWQPDATGSHRSDPATEAQLPLAGYDRLDKRQVMDQLREHSQTELEAVESYERSHQNRGPVLDKLRYMRGREPLPGYDSLSVGKIVAALERADPAAIDRVRAYERKFANRPGVLEEVVRVQHRRKAAQTKSAAPSYQPLGGALTSSAPLAHPEKSARP